MDKSELNVQVGNAILQLRTNKGLSREKMAEHLDMTTQCYASLERGFSSASIYRLYRISEVFGCNMSQFFNEQSWCSDVPTKAGEYLMRCMENDFKTEVIRIKFDNVRGLIAECPHLGCTPLSMYHSGLTSISWKLID